MAKARHGMTGTPAWRSWKGMIQRCGDPNHKTFANYGARGVTVCNRWLTFVNFFSDMGERPEGKSIGRIDNTRGYSPDNCRWETASQQNKNRRSFRSARGDNITERMIVANGRTQSLKAWAAELGVDTPTLIYRVRAGWSQERVVDPVIHHGLRRK